MSRVILIAGPTASGKSALALRLAEDLGGVVINADSMQVYAGLRVLTARPSAADEARAPHRLYGTVADDVAYSAADWAAAAMAEIEAAHDAGKVPILVGGTGMYFKVLLGGIAEIPEIPEDIRARVRAKVAAEGSAAAHAELAPLDPAAAARLSPGDSQRVSRALEVVLATGRPITDWQADTKPGPLAPPDAAGLVEKIVLDWPREELYARCDLRFELMLEEGALAEVEALMARNLDPTLPVMKALGVPTLAAYLDGEVDLEAAKAESQMQTRRFAKRQLTWFRNQFGDWPRWSAQYYENIYSDFVIKISK